MPVEDRRLRQIVGDAPGHRAAIEHRRRVGRRCARARCAAARRTGGGSDTTRPAGRAAPRSRWCARATRARSADRVVWSTASHRPPHIRSSTEVCLRNRASASGSRDRSSRRKYSDTNRSSPVKLAAPCRARRAGLQRQRREVQAGGPALRPPGQLGELGRVELDARGCQQQPGLLLVEPEVRRRRSRAATALASASGQAAAPGFSCWRSRSASRPERTRTARRARRGRTGWRRRAGRRAPAPAGARARQRAPDARERASTRSIRPGPDSASNTSGRDRLDAVDRGRDVAQEHDGVVVRPSRATHANGRGSASAHRASSVVLPYPAGATTVANGSRDARSRAITSVFATVPGLVCGATSFVSTRSKGASATVIA